MSEQRVGQAEHLEVGRRLNDDLRMFQRVIEVGFFDEEDRVLGKHGCVLFHRWEAETDRLNWGVVNSEPDVTAFRVSGWHKGCSSDADGERGGSAD